MSGVWLSFVGVATAAAGYVIGRVRPLHRLDRRTWRRITFGPGDGERPLGWCDVAAWTLLHPVSMAQTIPWSPFYKPPKPRPSIDAAELFPKLNIPDGNG